MTSESRQPTRSSEISERDFQIRALRVYASLAITLGIYHALSINFGEHGVLRMRFHEGILDGVWRSPYQYRVAVPFAAEALSRFFELFGVSQTGAREAGYVAIRIASNFALFALFDRLCCRWLTRELALAATLLFAGACLYTMRSYYFQPSSALNIALLAGAAVCALEGRLRALYAVMFVAALNRETSGLIVALFVAAQFGKTGWPLHTAGLLAVWGAVQFGLRFMFGDAQPFPARPWTANFEPTSLLWVAGLFGLVWALPFLRQAGLPGFLRRALWLTAPALIVANFAFGKVGETRLFLDLGLVLVPATFIVLFGSKADSAE